MINSNHLASVGRVAAMWKQLRPNVNKLKNSNWNVASEKKMVFALRNAWKLYISLNIRINGKILIDWKRSADEKNWEKEKKKTKTKFILATQMVFYRREKWYSVVTHIRWETSPKNRNTTSLGWGRHAIRVMSNGVTHEPMTGHRITSETNKSRALAFHVDGAVHSK